MSLANAPRCASCGKAGNDLKVCGGCKVVWYCNAACQRAHRPAHKVECRISVATKQTMEGKLTFSGDRPAQNFIFCGSCGSHFMLCGCTGHRHGVDYILKGLPTPKAKLNRIELLRRFACNASALPAMRAFDAMAWHANEAVGIAGAIEHRRSSLKKMVNEYVASLPASGTMGALAAAVGGGPLQEQSGRIQSTVIANECHAAVSTFISGDWSTLTRMGCILINNAFQASDGNRYSIADPHLRTVFGGGVECLLTMFTMGYSDHGYMLAMECDRPPEGTEQPFQSAAGRCDRIANICNGSVEVAAE